MFDPDRPRKKGPGQRKNCAFCVDRMDYIDYKEIKRLQRYVSERGKIQPRRRSGACSKHQRILAIAIKQARHMALLSFVRGHTAH